MRRIGTVIALGMGIACAARVSAEDDPLPLIPPSAAPDPGSPGAEIPPPVESAPPTAPSSVLALPGLSTPGARRAQPGLPPLEPAGPSLPSELPSLTGPAGTPEPLPGPGSEVRPLPRERSRPLTVESVPGGAPAGSGSPRPLVRNPLPAPRRPPGLFGRFFPPPMTLTRPLAVQRDSITVEPGNDPASDAALKRRIEHQVRQAAGDRLRSVEVRVVGRDITIRAQASRFWQKRSLRRSLESLPSLSGLRTTIDVD